MIRLWLHRTREDLPGVAAGRRRGVYDGCQLGLEKLEGDLAVVPAVVGELDRGHTALARTPASAPQAWVLTRPGVPGSPRRNRGSRRAGPANPRRAPARTGRRSIHHRKRDTEPLRRLARQIELREGRRPRKIPITTNRGRRLRRAREPWWTRGVRPSLTPRLGLW